MTSESTHATRVASRFVMAYVTYTTCPTCSWGAHQW